MANRRRRVLLVAGLASLALHRVGSGQSASPASGPDKPDQHRLFAVEFKTGPRWQQDKKPGEQEYFRDHSANLRKLREQGSLVLGGRYGDKGLIILSAESEVAARAMIDQDPSVKNGVFRYELHEFAVFYGGAVQPRPRGP